MASTAAAQNIPDQGPTLIIISTLFLTITTLFFVTRLLWRLSHTQQLGWDDLMASLAYLTLVIQTSFGYAAAHYGFGKHRADLSKMGFEEAMRWFWAYQICYKLLGGFTKLNFCFLYLRIFDGSGLKTFQALVWTTAGIITAGTLAFTIATLTQCHPIQRNWNHAITGSCINYLAFWFTHAVFNTLMDLVVYILPIQPLLNLQVARRTKSGLLAIFALGAFTIAASIVRMAMLPRSAKSTSDPTWGSMPALIWTEVEANTAVICCCLPALRIVAVRCWERIKGDKVKMTTTTFTTGARPGRPKVGAWAGVPRSSKGFGLTTEARYSPGGAADNGNEVLPEEEEQQQQQQQQRGGWFHRPLRSMSPLETTFPPSSASHDGGTRSPAIEGNYSPQLEPFRGLGIRKTTQVQMSSSYRDSTSELPRMKRKMEARPERQSMVGTGEGSAERERSMTLKEILDDGPQIRRAR